MTWNKKNQQFALSCKLRPSSKELIQWVLRRAKPGSVGEIEIDLRVFNKFIEGDRGREYDRKTLKEALAQLDEKTQGLILITKSYTWSVHKILVRPLEFILREKFPKLGNTPKLSTGNPMFSEDHKARLHQQQQQDISKIDSLLQQVGLKYDRDALNRIWRLAGKQTENVVKAIELMVYRHQNKEIPRPHGFIIDCLKHSWQEGFNIYYEPELPRFQSKSQLLEFTLLIRALGKT